MTLVTRVLWMAFWSTIAAVGLRIQADPSSWLVGRIGHAIHEIGFFCSLVCVLRRAYRVLDSGARRREDARMSERTGIEWTDKTWNPWHGCTQVSPGCAHCYMYREKHRYGQKPEIIVSIQDDVRRAAPLEESSARLHVLVVGLLPRGRR